MEPTIRVALPELLRQRDQWSRKVHVRPSHGHTDLFMRARRHQALIATARPMRDRCVASINDAAHIGAANGLGSGRNGGLGQPAATFFVGG